MRAKKTVGKYDQRSDMETGLVLPDPPRATKEQLPAYEELTEPTRTEL